ncbi:uncharacterized protein V6R79_003465 [Siganus canaliculatus]
MEPPSRAEQPFPTPPPYFLPEGSERGQEVRVYHVHPPYSPPPPPPPSAFFPPQTLPPLPVLALPPPTPMPKFVSYETALTRSPALATCPICQTQVITQVTFRVGVHAWLACVLFLLFGLLLGCCLIPFFVDYFKDAYHSCPRCRRVLHVHRKTCCD